jgi:putative colanic acid biosynthesis acetyltransferase WcaF
MSTESPAQRAASATTTTMAAVTGPTGPEAPGATATPERPCPVIPLRDVPAGDFPAGRSRVWEAAWRLVEWALVTNALQPSSSLRAAALRAFGADIGQRVIIRPRVRVRFPWNLSIGDDCWIGEGVWFSNRDHVRIESDVVLSQDTFVTTGSHATATDMHETSAPVVFRSGTWITSRCIILGGVETGTSSLVTPGTVVAESVPAGAVYGQGKPRVIRQRFAQ